MFEAEAKALRLRPRPSLLRPRLMPKFWPQGHFGLEDLTSLITTKVVVAVVKDTVSPMKLHHFNV